MSTDTTPDLSYADTPWKSADALRGQVDAAEYKHVVLGPLFLTYVSDSFQSRRDELQAGLTKAGMTSSAHQRRTSAQVELKTLGSNPRLAMARFFLRFTSNLFA